MKTEAGSEVEKRGMASAITRITVFSFFCISAVCTAWHEAQHWFSTGARGIEAGSRATHWQGG